jgi:hypothetical protein
MGVLDPPAAPYAPARTGPARPSTGRVLFTEDFSDGILGMYNDGIGSASVDHNIRFNGLPSVRLDPQTVSGTATFTGGNQQLVLGGSAQTITTTPSATLVGTTTQAGTPALAAAGYITLISTTGGAGPTADGNSYVLSYTSAVVSGVTTAWVVTFSGVKILAIPGTPNTTVTTQNIGTATMACGNPNPNPTGNAQPTASVVFKRRINDQFSGKFGHELWWKPTSKSTVTSATSSFCHRLYNRDGYSGYAGSIYPQSAVGMTRQVWSNDFMLLWASTGTGSGGSNCTWIPLGFHQGAFAQHAWDPVGGSWDRAGCWNYSKIILDMSAHAWVSYQFNETLYTSIAGTPVYQSTGDTGAKIMHFSVEAGMAQSSARRFFNVAHIVGTAE